MSRHPWNDHAAFSHPPYSGYDDKREDPRSDLYVQKGRYRPPAPRNTMQVDAKDRLMRLTSDGGMTGINWGQVEAESARMRAAERDRENSRIIRDEALEGD